MVQRRGGLGTNLPRRLDAGIPGSRVGLVFVTPAMLMALRHGGFADQELGALLSTGERIDEGSRLPGSCAVGT